MCLHNRPIDPSQSDQWPDVYEKYSACRFLATDIRASFQLLE